MATTGRLDLQVWRNDDVYEFMLRVRGPDLTNVPLRAQVRLDRDTPGAPLVNLATVTNANAEGIRLAGTSLVGGVVENDVRIRINKITRQNLPYAGELGDSAKLKWAFQIAGRTRIVGQFTVLAHTIDSDNAPTNRSASFRSTDGDAPAPGAILTIAGEDVAELVIDGIELVAGQVDAATTARNDAITARDTAQLAAASATASSRYFPTRAAGEAGSVTNQLFSTDDGAGNVVYYRKNASGSTEVGRAVTPVSLSPYSKKADVETLSGKTFAGITKFATNGDRIGVTSANTPLTPDALFHIRNEGSLTNGLRVQSYWTGTTAQPFTNNDTILIETFNRAQSDSANLSWSISAPNAYNDIPVSVHDSGERVGVYGWATSVFLSGSYEHRGRLTSQIGVRGRAGFQGTGTPNTAVIDRANGVQGEIRADSAGATIRDARAGYFTSIISASTGIIENNYGVYSEASGGTAANWSFFGAAGPLYNRDRIFAGEGAFTAAQSASDITARGALPNAVEFGNGDPAGFGSNIGATSGSGTPFLLFCGEANASGNTFRTRGKRGVLVTTDLAGALIFSRLTTATSSSQAPVESARFDASGRLVLAQVPTFADDAAAGAGGLVAGTVYKTSAGALMIKS